MRIDKKVKNVYLPKTVTFVSIQKIIDLFNRSDIENTKKIRINAGVARKYSVSALLALKIIEDYRVDQYGKHNFRFFVERNKSGKINKFTDYLARMNYFYNYSRGPLTNERIKPSNGRFLKLVKTTQKTYKQDIQKFVDTFKKEVSTDSLFLSSLEYIFKEIVLNIFDHSGKPYGFLMTQNEPNYLEICIADSGIGFLKSLEEKYNVSTHSSAIQKAMESGISSSNPSLSLYSTDSNKGQGL